MSIAWYDGQFVYVIDCDSDGHCTIMFSDGTYTTVHRDQLK